MTATPSLRVPTTSSTTGNNIPQLDEVKQALMLIVGGPLIIYAQAVYSTLISPGWRNLVASRCPT